MAKDKKGFVLYADLIHTVKKLPPEQQAKLFVHVLEYVNDLNPETDDILVDVAFESVKQQLKRDLKKYEKRAENSRENGKLGGRPITQKTQRVKKEPRKPDTVTVTDTVKENDILKENSEWRNNFLKHYQINLEEYLKRLSAFSLAYDMERSDKELKQHFFNWFKTQDYKKYSKGVPHWNENLKIDIGK